MALREKVTEAMLLRNPIPADKVFDKKHPYHYKDFKDNLFASMAGQYDRLLLVNVVNEFPPECIWDTKAQAEYITAIQEEQCEAAEFITLIQESDIPRLFDNNCNAGIDVMYLSAKDFAAGVVMPQAKKEYLKRYFA